MAYCKHAICRNDAQVELAYLAELFGREDLAMAAAESRIATVKCRLQPRFGMLRAPLARNAERDRVGVPPRVQFKTDELARAASRMFAPFDLDDAE